MSNESRLKVLRAAIEDEGPVDGIHNDEVRELYEGGGECPRYLGCTSEGSGESTYRDNPDFFAGDLHEVAAWLGSSYEEGWAANWVFDLDDARAPSWRAQLDWAVFVQLPAGSTTPTVLDSRALLDAAGEVLIERKGAEGHRELTDALADVVNRSLGREPGELEQTRELIGRAPAGARLSASAQTAPPEWRCRQLQGGTCVWTRRRSSPAAMRKLAEERDLELIVELTYANCGYYSLQPRERIDGRDLR